MGNINTVKKQSEKLMGIDPTKTRTKAVLKKLAILRNAIIMSNYRDEVLRWETVLHKVDQSQVFQSQMILQTTEK